MRERFWAHCLVVMLLENELFRGAQAITLGQKQDVNKKKMYGYLVAPLVEHVSCKSRLKSEPQ